MSETRSNLTTYLFSECNGKKASATRYVTNRVGYPDAGSDFDRALGCIKYVFRIPIANAFLASVGIQFLRERGYDALLCDNNHTIIGHTAFQVHRDNTLHIFSVEVLPGCRGHHYGRHMVEETLEVARRKGIDRVRIGGGKSPATNRILEQLVNDRFDIVPTGGNWVTLL